MSAPQALLPAYVRGLPERFAFGQPFIVQFGYEPVPRLRVNEHIGCFCDGDVFGRPIFRVYLAAEAAFVGLGAVRLAVSHAVSGFAFAGLVSGDVRHW